MRHTKYSIRDCFILFLAAGKGGTDNLLGFHNVVPMKSSTADAVTYVWFMFWVALTFRQVFW